MDASVKTVIAAFKTRDIDAIEAFMCKNIKDSVPNLKAEIGKMIDLVEGQITSTSSKSTNVFYASSGGKKIEQAISNSIINSSATTYYLDITWEHYNNFSFAERGIRWIALYSKPGNEYEVLAKISATNGIEHWHD